MNPRVGGSHGDLAQSLALAVHEVRGSGGSPDGAAVGCDGFSLRDDLAGFSLSDLDNVF